MHPVPDTPCQVQEAVLRKITKQRMEYPGSFYGMGQLAAANSSTEQFAAEQFNVG